MLRTLLTRRAGQPGLCVRYRYDDEQRQRLKTVEIIIERLPWNRRTKAAAADPVHVRIEDHEDLLCRAILFAGGRWDEETDTWRLPRKAALALGLTTRIQRAPRSRAKRSTARSNRVDPNADRSDYR